MPSPSTPGPAETPAPPTVLIVIVNYRTDGLTLDCLASLAGQVASPAARARVVVVDNASADGSAGRIAEAIADRGWSSWAEVLPLGHNGGFAAGNNAAIRPALASNDPPRYIWLLNPDTVARPGALEGLVGFLETHPEVGLAGSRLEDPDGSPQRSAFRFPTVLGELEAGLRLGLATRMLSRWVVAPPPPPAACPTDWASGASLMVRLEVFRDIGPLDEGFFMYFEEVDLCRRARDAGWPCWYVPSSRVVHLGGRSSGVDDRREPTRRRPTYWFASRRRYAMRHLGPARTALADLCWAAGFASYRLRRPMQGKPDTDPRRLLADFIGYNFGPGRRGVPAAAPGPDPAEPARGPRCESC